MHCSSIVWASSDADRMRRVLGAWDEHLADPHLPRRLAGLIGFITAFVPGRGGVTPDESAAWADDLAGLGRGYFFSLNRYLSIASK